MWRCTAALLPRRMRIEGRSLLPATGRGETEALVARPPAGDRQEVCAEAQEGRLLLDGAGGPQGVSLPFGIVPHLSDQPSRALDPEEGLEAETCVLDLRAEFVRMVEVCRGEPFDPVGRIAVLPVSQVAFD